MGNMTHEAISRVLISLAYEDMVKVRFTMENTCKSMVEFGGKVKEVTTKYLVISINCAEGIKTMAIGVERIVAIEKITIPKEVIAEKAPERVNFCEQPKITDRFIDTIQQNIKTTRGGYMECGKWDALPMDVRRFLTDCAEYLLSLECVAQEGIELKQSIEKAHQERKGKTLYEKNSYVYAAMFKRTQGSEPEMGYLINEDNLVDSTGQTVSEVYDCQTRDDLGTMQLYVPVRKEVSEADCPSAAERVLNKLIAALKGKYHTAQSRQYNGGKPSGRMYGLGEAIDLLTEEVARIKKGDYDA